MHKDAYVCQSQMVGVIVVTADHFSVAHQIGHHPVVHMPACSQPARPISAKHKSSQLNPEGVRG